MIVRATQTYTRQAPRKVRLVANTVKKLSLKAALEQLAVMPRDASVVVMKVLRQAIANAIHNHNIAFEELSIKSILVDEGPRYKRFRAVSRGRAHSIVKRTSHVAVVLQTNEAVVTQQETPKEVAVNEVVESTKAVAKKTPVKKSVQKKK